MQNKKTFKITSESYLKVPLKYTYHNPLFFHKNNSKQQTNVSLLFLTSASIRFVVIVKYVISSSIPIVL